MVRLEVIAAMGSVAVVVMSIYPGLLIGTLFLAILLVPAALTLAALGAVVYGLAYLAWTFLPYRLGRGRLRPHPPEAGRAVAIGEVGRNGAFPASRVIAWAVIVVSLALWRTGLPMRAAFAASRPAFERCVRARIPIGPESGAPSRFLGLYRVDDCREDPRGGVYFRCLTHPDGIGPDTMSYGFAFRPNREGSPFGNSHQALQHLGGDWFVFAASDDW